MTRADTRDVVDRAEDIARTASFELRTGVKVNRCECGASVLLAAETPTGFACAGCGHAFELGERVSPHASRSCGGESVARRRASARRLASAFLNGWRS